MSKVTDSWNDYEAAKAKLAELTAARADVATVYEEAAKLVQLRSTQIADEHEFLQAAKAELVKAGDALKAELELAACGKPSSSEEAWALYVSARETVAAKSNRLTILKLDRDEVRNQRDDADSAATAARDAVDRAEKLGRDAAEKLRALVASEVAGYCGKLAPRADGEQVVLSSAETVQP